MDGYGHVYSICPVVYMENHLWQCEENHLAVIFGNFFLYSWKVLFHLQSRGLFGKGNIVEVRSCFCFGKYYTILVRRTKGRLLNQTLSGK